MDNIKIVGLTGGVGTGKTTVIEIIEKQFHIPVIVCDRLGKEVMEPGMPAYDRIIESFGNAVVDANGALDRNLLAKMIFEKPELNRVLSGIVHPLVLSEIDHRIEKAKQENDKWMVIESAILFESGLDKKCDEIWAIYTKPEIRRERLKQSRGYSDEKITAMMNSQMSWEETKAQVDRVIYNNDSIDEIAPQLEKFLV
ncbi:MAG: dephospho-CoA kinase [Lachnospiraceae bacterium]|nr:dephospho-CoA kinase [Lachnospiraceae bacterium]